MKNSIGVTCILATLLYPWGSARAGAPAGGVELSTVQCGCIADANGGASTQLPYRCTISPSGGALPWVRSEDIVTTVVIRNAFGVPLPGATVRAYPVNLATSVATWDPGPPPAGDLPESPQTGVSDANGLFIAVFDEGGLNHNAPPVAYPNLDMAVTYQVPGHQPVALAGCAYYGNSQLTVTSYDLNGDCKVTVADLSIFASQYGSESFIPRIADFNWDGRVDIADLSLFAVNYGASCDNN